MSQPIVPLPAAAVIAGDLTDDEQVARDPEETRDVEDAEPVGAADRNADVERSGGDPDEA